MVENINTFRAFRLRFGPYIKRNKKNTKKGMGNTEGEKEKKLDISEFVWFNDANENFRKLQEELQLYGTCFLKSISK